MLLLYSTLLVEEFTNHGNLALKRKHILPGKIQKVQTSGV